MKEELSKSYLSIGQSLLIVGIVILGTLVFAPLLMMLNEAIGKEAATLLYYLFSMGVPLWIVSSIRKRRLKHTSINFKIEHPQILPLLIAVTIPLVFGIISPIAEMIPMPEGIKETLIEAAHQKGIFTFITMVIVAPLVEELIFRGIMLDGLLRKYSPAMSILISSFLFGLVHLNPWQLIAGFLVGILIGWVYYKTKSLAYAIIIHSATNLCGYLLRVFSNPDSLVNTSLIEFYGGGVNLILIMSGSIITISVFVYLLKKVFSQKKLKLATPNTKL